MTHTNFPSQIKTAAQNAEARKLRILNERLWHFTSVGLGNCRAAQRVRREIECRIALLANANFNPNEPRDRQGRWTNGTNAAGSATNKLDQHITRLAAGAPASGPGAKMSNEPDHYITNLSSSVGATINAAPIKFGLGVEQGLQQVASDIGQGLAQFSDPGPLNKDSFGTFLRAQDQALQIVPNPHLDPDTGQWTVADPYTTALNQMDQQRELERERARIPGESFSQAAGETADGLGAVKDALPGPKIIGTAGQQAGQIAGYMAPSAIPYVGWLTGAATAGLASAGDTFDQAFEIYKLAGYPEAKAREMARDVALRNGTMTALIFALPVGRLAALPESALGRILAAAGISGTQLSADKLQTLLHAKATYNPNLTFGDIAREAGLTFLYGAGFGAVTHGAAEASGVDTVTASDTRVAQPERPASRDTQAAQTDQPLARGNQSSDRPVAAKSINEVITDGQTPAKKSYFNYGQVTDEVANKIKQIGGPDVTTYEHRIEADAVRKILNDHGQDHYPVTEEDFKKLPEIVNSPDKITVSPKETRQGLIAIQYEKRFNGTTIVVEEVRTGYGRLALKTMYKTKGRSD